jgi:uncharacterized protein YbbC (DUF1343 family)
MVTTGLEAWWRSADLQRSLKGRIGLLCHNASCTSDFVSAPELLQEVYGKRLIRLFGPQHGLITDVQDNMIETGHFTHPYFKLPVFSLYSETRIPTDEMLDGLNTLVVDLQDVGTRVYTYISTLALIMNKLQEKGSDLELVIFDRPNPVRGDRMEGPGVVPELLSFVGQINVPHRHGLTMGEVAQFIKQTQAPDVNLRVIPMQGWKRDMDFTATGLPWINPSPNLPTIESALVFPATVLYEGTNLSEGRGTTRSLELVGHPKLESYKFARRLNEAFERADLVGMVARPTYFRPTFQKWANQTCGGVQIHPIDSSRFRPWAVGQVILREAYHSLGEDFEWNTKPYEYETRHPAIDYINGQFALKTWVETNGSIEELLELEKHSRAEYEEIRESILLYS